MSRAWCPMSGRPAVDVEMKSYTRKKCPQCGRRLVVRYGLFGKHRLPAYTADPR